MDVASVELESPCRIAPLDLKLGDLQSVDGHWRSYLHAVALEVAGAICRDNDAEARLLQLELLQPETAPGGAPRQIDRELLSCQIRMLCTGCEESHSVQPKPKRRQPVVEAIGLHAAVGGKARQDRREHACPCPGRVQGGDTDGHC